jgi:hypothetical protein
MGLCEQVEATQSTNKRISKLFSMMSTLQAANITTPPSPLVSLPTPIATTRRSVLHSSWMGSVLHSPHIEPGTPDSFDVGRVKGCAFLASLELYLSLTGSDFPDDQSHIHWALSYFKSRCAATFAECVVKQEMKSGVMIFAGWSEFTLQFMATFCPENEVTAVRGHPSICLLPLSSPTLPFVYMYFPHTSSPFTRTTLKGRRLSHSQPNDFPKVDPLIVVDFLRPPPLVP